MADIVADELRKFIQTCLSNIEDDESIASMSFEDCERCLKLMLASQIPNEKVARFVCGCVDPARVYGLEINRGAMVPPAFYRYVFENASVDASDACLKQFERVSQVTGSPQRLLRAFHAQNVNNFRDEVLDIANGHVGIGNALYTTLRSLGEEAQPTKEELADLWQHHVSFPFLKDGRVVLTSVIQEKQEEEEKLESAPLEPVPLANALVAEEATLSSVEPILRRYCVESKLPKHTWHYDFTVNQCVQVALGSAVTELHRDQSAASMSSLKFQLTQQELATLLEYHLLQTTGNVAELVRDNAQTRLYHRLVSSGDIVHTPARFLASIIAHHYASPETLPERYRDVCPTLEPAIKRLLPILK